MSVLYLINVIASLDKGYVDMYNSLFFRDKSVQLQECPRCWVFFLKHYHFYCLVCACAFWLAKH